MTSLVLKAKEFAAQAHQSIDQRRKYTGLPYETHVNAVADLVATVLPDNEIALAAAYLHDVAEDTPISLNQIKDEFGADIRYVVNALTHVYTAEAFPLFNRKGRKEMEAKRLGAYGKGDFSLEIHTIKLADLIDNTEGESGIVKYDKKFAKVYLEEKEYLLRQLTQGHRILQERAWKSLNEGLAALT